MALANVGWPTEGCSQGDSTMTPGKIWMKCARFMLLLVPTLALAMPGFAQVRDATLLDSQEPGSVIVFPKFLTGTLVVDGVTLPATEIEVGIVCPRGAPFFGVC